MARVKVACTDVIIIWSTAELLSDGIVNCLDSYVGTRVYKKDCLDPRLLSLSKPSLRFFDTLDSAMEYMAEHPNEQIQLDLREARRCGLVSGRALREEFQSYV